MKTRTAVVNSATSRFPRKSLVSALWPNTSSDWMNLAKTYRCAARVCRAVSVAGCQRPTLQLTKRPETTAFLQLSQRTVEACGILTILGQNVMGFHSQHSVNITVNTTVNTAKTMENRRFLDFHPKKAKILHFILKNV